MKATDEGRGGGTDNSDDLPPNAPHPPPPRFMRTTVAVNVKRKTSKSDSSSSSSAALKNCDEQCKDLTLSSDAIRKRKSSSSRKLLRSDSSSESTEGAERNLRKSKSDSIRTTTTSNHNNVSNSVRLRKTKFASDESTDVRINGGIENVADQNEKDDEDVDGNCKDFGVCEEKLISSSTDNVTAPEYSPGLSVLAGGHENVLEDEEHEEEDDVEEEEEEEESFDVKEINIPTESKIANEESENHKVVNEQEKIIVVKKPENDTTTVANELDKKMVVKEPEKKAVIDEPVVNKKASNVNSPEPKRIQNVNSTEPKRIQNVSSPEPKRIQSAYKRFHQNNERTASIPAVTVKQSLPVRRHSTIYQNFAKDNSQSKYHSFPQTQSKLQSLVDLIMWREISRSAFVFGGGTFVIVSSSYAQDINVSFISVMSYLGLVYLAVIFLYRSLICRGIIDVDDKNYVLGEEEASWVLKLILPYLNELLSKLRALFSGDPGTTMKLAVLLFVLARCGNSITIWKMAKFGFFGIFTVPKVCSSYSAQLTAYGNFWVRRFRDAWDSCSHKKAVALGIFSLVWNMSSVVARVWAVFVLFVAFKYYQQHYMVRDEYVEDEEEEVEEEAANEGDTWQAASGGKNEGLTHIKIKKGF